MELREAWGTLVAGSAMAVAGGYRLLTRFPLQGSGSTGSYTMAG